MKSLKDSYLYYKEELKGTLSKKVYLSISADYAKFLANKVLAGASITLPSRLGYLEINGKEQKIQVDEDGNIKGLAPDWVKTKKLWEENEEAKRLKKRLYHLNAHTNNYRYKFFWSKKRVLVENKTLYSLRMTRDNKRSSSKNIFKGKTYKTR